MRHIRIIWNCYWQYKPKALLVFIRAKGHFTLRCVHNVQEMYSKCTADLKFLSLGPMKLILFQLRVILMHRSMIQVPYIPTMLEFSMSPYSKEGVSMVILVAKDNNCQLSVLIKLIKPKRVIVFKKFQLQKICTYLTSINMPITQKLYFRKKSTILGVWDLP